LNKIALSSFGDIFETASYAVEEEKDLDIVKPAILSNAKLLEGLLKTDPENVKIATLSIKSLFFTSFSYLESEYEKYQFSDFKKAENYKKRASDVYRRAFLYGEHIIEDECSDINSIENTTYNTFINCIDDLDHDLKEMIFWMGFAWSKYIFLNSDKAKHVGQLSKLLYMMNWVEKYDEGIHFGSLYIFYGVYYASMPKTLGGDPVKSLMYFKKANDFNSGSNLMVNLFKAQYYTRQVLDREMFKNELDYVISYNGNHDPRLGLINSLSKQKAKTLLSQIDEYF